MVQRSCRYGSVSWSTKSKVQPGVRRRELPLAGGNCGLADADGRHTLAFTTGFATVLLPWLFRDACIIARVLGIRYIWIDALVSRSQLQLVISYQHPRAEKVSSNRLSQCLLQGRGGDWHVEALKMASICGGAFLTIAFADGSGLGNAAAASRGYFPGLDTNTAGEGGRQHPTLDPGRRSWLDGHDNFRNTQNVLPRPVFGCMPR